MPSIQDYRTAVAFYRPRCHVLDETLYSLCSDNHADLASVTAKVWLIARTYSTGLERWLNDDNLVHGRANKLHGFIDYITGNQEALEVFTKLREVKEPLDDHVLHLVSDLHTQFMGLLCSRIRGEGASVPSFVSKYLHFHNPAIPIYDSRARKALQNFYGQNYATSSYSRFLDGFLQAYQELSLEAATQEVNTRNLDYYLLWEIERPA